MHINLKKQSGFTLIEFVVVIVIMGIIAAISSQMIATGLTSYLSNKDVLNATAQARLAIERITRDIRSVRSSSDISTATATQFTFTDTNGNSISYTLSGTSLMRGSQVLADGIASLSFTYYDKNGSAGPATANIRYVTVALNVTQGNTNFNVDTTVYPRNLP